MLHNGFGLEPDNVAGIPDPTAVIGLLRVHEVPLVPASDSSFDVRTNHDCGAGGPIHRMSVQVTFGPKVRLGQPLRPSGPTTSTDQRITQRAKDRRLPPQ